MLVNDVKTTNFYNNDLSQKSKYSSSSSTIKFKDGSSFNCSFNYIHDSGMMVDQMNEYRNMFNRKLHENDYVWLIYMDDFKALYEKPELLKHADCFFWDKIDLLFVIFNTIVCFLIGMGYITLAVS